MQVTIKNDEKIIVFCEVPIGHIFLDDRRVFIKINDVNAINLINGGLRSFATHQEVIKLNQTESCLEVVRL